MPAEVEGQKARASKAKLLRRKVCQRAQTLKRCRNGNPLKLKISSERQVEEGRGSSLNETY